MNQEHATFYKKAGGDKRPFFKPQLLASGKQKKIK